MNERCKDVVEERWKSRQKDLRNNEFEPLGFDYVEPGTWPEQLEGYYRWQFSWGGPSDELRAYINKDNSIHRLEYWFMDWMDGAKLELQPDTHGENVWQRLQEMIEVIK